MRMTQRDKILGIWLERRFVPFPRSISPEAYAYLASFVTDEGKFKMQSSAPGSFAEWVAAKAAAEPMIAQIASQMAGTITATTQRVEMAGAQVHVATPDGEVPRHRAFLEIHGGALVYGGGETCRLGACISAQEYQVTAYGVDYRTPPEAPYPAALDDCLAVYRALLDRYAPENIVVGGGSAGGNLAAALALRARDEGLPLPAGLVLMTPELDLTESGDSFETNQFIDVVLRGSLAAANALYANGHDLADPYLSPLFGDFSKGFPPTIIQSGTRDLFLSNAVRMHRALRRAGVPAEIHIGEGMPHAGFLNTAEDKELRAEIRRFVAEHWAT